MMWMSSLSFRSQTWALVLNMSNPQCTLSVFLLFCLVLMLLAIFRLSEASVTRGFCCLFIFRYWRLVVGIVSYFSHQCIPICIAPRFGPDDILAILPTINPKSKELLDTVISVLESGVGHVIVVVPQDKYADVNFFQRLDLVKHLATGRLRIEKCSVTNKRRQVSVGLRCNSKLRKSIVVLVDDHVLWPSGPKFLSSILAPFQDAEVGGVAMWKKGIRKTCTLFSSTDFWNLIGCLYLERHNFDITASHFVDGGLFVISGRTAAYRSEILCTEDFIQAFCNEQWWCFGNIGAINCDDDNFITRWLVNKRWKIGWQHGSDATMVTTIGETGFEKFNSQCLRWARTTWRQNSKTLVTDRIVYSTQPWSVYSIFVTSFLNFALFTDVSLVYLSWSRDRRFLWFMMVWIFCSKLVKPIPHFFRHPRDLVYLFPYILFGYYHSLLKLYALFTARNISWGSRPGVVN